MDFRETFSLSLSSSKKIESATLAAREKQPIMSKPIAMS